MCRLSNSQNLGKAGTCTYQTLSGNDAERLEGLVYNSVSRGLGSRGQIQPKETTYSSMPCGLHNRQLTLFLAFAPNIHS